MDSLHLVLHLAHSTSSCHFSTAQWSAASGLRELGGGEDYRMTSCISTVFMDSSYSTGYVAVTHCKLMGSGTWSRMFMATSSTTCRGKETVGVRAGSHNPCRIPHAQSSMGRSGR